MSDITVTPDLLDEIDKLPVLQHSTARGYLVSINEDQLHAVTMAHRTALVRIRELEAENAKLKHDIAAYVEANSDLLDECDAARGRALEEAAAIVDIAASKWRSIAALNDGACMAAKALEAASVSIRSLITKEGE